VCVPDYFNAINIDEHSLQSLTNNLPIIHDKNLHGRPRKK